MGKKIFGYSALFIAITVVMGNIFSASESGPTASLTEANKATLKEDYLAVKTSGISVLDNFFDVAHGYTHFLETEEGAEYALSSSVPFVVDDAGNTIIFKNREAGHVTFADAAGLINFDAQADFIAEVHQDGGLIGEVDLLPPHSVTGMLTPSKNHFGATHYFKDVNHTITAKNYENRTDGEFDTIPVALLRFGELSLERNVTYSKPYSELKTSLHNWNGVNLGFRVTKNSGVNIQESPDFVDFSVESLALSSDFNAETLDYTFESTLNNVVVLTEEESWFSEEIERTHLQLPVVDSTMTIKKESGEGVVEYSGHVSDFVLNYNGKKGSFGKFSVAQTTTGMNVDELQAYYAFLGTSLRAGIEEELFGEVSETLRLEVAELVKRMMSEKFVSDFSMVSTLENGNSASMKGVMDLNENYAAVALDDMADFGALLEAVNSMHIEISVPKAYIVDQVFTAQTLFDEDFENKDPAAARKEIDEGITMGYMFMAMMLPQDYKLYDAAKEIFSVVIDYDGTVFTINGVALDLDEVTRLF